MKSNFTLWRHDWQKGMKTSALWQWCFGLIFLLTCVSSYGQISSYTFSESTDTYAQITGTTSTATGDDGSQNAISIGFTFNFGGTDYTTFSVNTNGFIRLGANIASSPWTNSVANATAQSPLISPFWDDNNLSTGTIRYTTTGTAPNRVLTVDWNQFKIGGGGSTSGASNNMLVRLYETTNVIEFVYGATFATTNTVTAYVGINSGTFISVTPGNPSTSSTATQNHSINNTVMQNLGGKMLSFSPPSCIAPGGLLNTNITLSSADHSWNAAVPTPDEGYEWAVTTSATPPSSGTTTTGLTASSTGLSANTTYYLHVRSECSAGVFSGWATSSFFTGYCLSTGTSSSTHISNVTFTGNTTLNNTSGANSGYANFTTVTPTVSAFAGDLVTYSVTATSDPGRSIFVDWNNNLVFDVPSERIFTSAAYVTGASTGSFSIPEGTPPGDYRVRVVVDWNATTPVPCNTNINGETEDYILTVLAPSTDEMDWNNIQWLSDGTNGSNTSLSAPAGTSITAYAQGYEAGITEAAGAGAGVEAWIGYSTNNDDPANTGWTWSSASFNSQVGNNDEFSGNLNLPAGTYYVASRWRLNNGPFTYGGYNGPWNGSGNNSIELIVTPNPTQCATDPVPADGTTGVTPGNITYTWSAPTSGPTPTSYEVWGGATSGSLSLITTVTTTSVSLIANAFETTLFIQIRPVSTVGGVADACAEWSFTTGPAPQGTYCSDPVVVTSGSYTAQPNIGGGFVPVPCAPFGGWSSALNGGHARWYSFTPSSNGTMIIKSCSATSIDTRLSVFSGTDCGALTCVAANDDEGTAGGGLCHPNNYNSFLSIPVIMGTTYLIQWDSNYATAFNNVSDWTLTFNPVLPSIASTSCDSTINLFHYDVINANTYAGATNYRFKIGTSTYDSSNGSATLANILGAGITFNTNYQVSVAAYGNGIWSEYGDECQISTTNAPMTEIQYIACGSTVPSLSTNIYFKNGYFAQMYEYRLTRVSDNFVFPTHSTTNRFVKLTDFPGVQIATEYILQARMMHNDVWGEYSAVCNIFSPNTLTTTLRPTYCGTTLANNFTPIYARGVAAATQYEFRVVNTTTSESGTVVRNSSAFHLGQVSGVTVSASTTYNVEVRVNVNGVWGPYGTMCTVMTPGVPSLLNNVSNGLVDEIIAFPNPFNNQFTIKLPSSEQANIQLFDINGRLIENRDINDAFEIEMGQNLNSGVYILRVNQNGESQSFKMIKK